MTPLTPYCRQMIELLKLGGGVQTTSQCEVLCDTLDHFCFDQHVHHIDILKMDVQGAGYRVLDGARQMLTQQRVSLIYMERGVSI